MMEVATITANRQPPAAAMLQDYGLTQRELEVLAMLATQRNSQEIAEKLNVSLQSIKNHNTRIFNKLEVRSRSEAIIKAVKLGLIKIN